MSSRKECRDYLRVHGWAIASLQWDVISHLRAGVVLKNQLPSLKLTNCTWKWMFGRLSRFLLGPGLLRLKTCDMFHFILVTHIQGGEHPNMNVYIWCECRYIHVYPDFFIRAQFSSFFWGQRERDITLYAQLFARPKQRTWRRCSSCG